MLSIRYKADTLQLFISAFCFQFSGKDTLLSLQHCLVFLFLFPFFYCYGLFVKFSNFSFLCFLKKREDVASGQRLYLAHAYWNKVCLFASAILSVCCVFSENTSRTNFFCFEGGVLSTFLLDNSCFSAPPPPLAS